LAHAVAAAVGKSDVDVVNVEASAPLASLHVESVSRDAVDSTNNLSASA